MEEAIAALDSQAAFTAALGDEAVFSAVKDDYDATKYGTVKASADISFNSTANTRFGIVSTTERANGRRRYFQQFLQICLESPGCSYFSTACGKNDSHVLGANDCLDGNRDGDESPEFISGDIELMVRLDTSRGSARRAHEVGTIEAVVSNLQDSDGNTFDNGEGDVESITLPDANIMDMGDTVGFESARAASTVKYVDRLEEEDLDGMYAGRFVGDGATDEDVPLAAIGLWHLCDRKDDSSNAAYRDLVGSWGAELSALTPDEVKEVTPAEPEGGDAFTEAALARMKTTFGEDAVEDKIGGGLPLLI